MGNKQPMYSHCTLFTTALCNLQCKYCYICKDVNGGLRTIDKEIEEGFSSGKFLQQIIDLEPNIVNTLDSITLWGGEPFLYLERFTNVFDDWANTFQNLKTIDISSNFTVETMPEKLQALLLKIENEYQKNPIKEAPFVIDLQLSIDGYPEMNDFGRGENVTKRVLANLEKICQLNYDKNLIFLNIFTKPTLSRSTFQFLDTEEKCFKWFNFFQTELYNLVHKYNNPFHSFRCSLFNCAGPTEWIKEDGELFASIIKNIQSVQNQVFEKCPDWKEREISLNPITNKIIGCSQHIFSLDDYGKNFSGPRCGGGCGVFSFSVTPIPHDKFALCHRGIFEEYTEYCNNIKDKKNINGLANQFFKIKEQSANHGGSVFSAEELKKYKKMFDNLYTHDNKIFYTDLITFIREYARTNIINPKYLSIKEINPTLGYFFCGSYCVADAYVFTGSWVTRDMLEVPLLYNGAMEATIEELQKILREKGEIHHNE